MPKHLKYLSILLFVSAAVAAIVGIVGLISMRSSPFAGGEPVITALPWTNNVVLQFGLLILLTTLAILFIVFLGISLRKLKPWARYLSLVFSLGSLFFGLVSLISGDHNFSIGFLIQVYAVWVLFRPDVKEAFGVKTNNQQCYFEE